MPDALDIAVPIRAPKRAARGTPLANGAAAPAPVDIDAVPLHVGGIRIDEIVNYKATDDGGNDVLSTRVPIQWITIIDEIVANRNWPQVKRGEWLRLAIRRLMRESSQYLGSLEATADGANMANSELDATTKAYEFSDRIMGIANARTAIAQKIRTQVRAYSIEVKEAMLLDDLDEATMLITFYVDNVDELGLKGYWKQLAIHALFSDIELKLAITTLIMAGKITHEVLIAAAIQMGLVPEAISHHDPRDERYDPSPSDE